jgi:hypothetical protein
LQTPTLTPKNESNIHFRMLQDIAFSRDWRAKKLLYPTRTIRLATMFSGIGAIEFALKRLRLKTNIIFASDNNKFVKQSYFKNYDIDDSRWYNDVHDIKGKKYQGKIDLLVGGSPCQSFSFLSRSSCPQVECIDNSSVDFSCYCLCIPSQERMGRGGAS